MAEQKSKEIEAKSRKKPINPNSLANLNPHNGKNGRKKLPKEFKELAEKNTVPALEVVLNIMNDAGAKHTDRLKAAEMVLDRAIGKPKQQTELTGLDGGALVFAWAGFDNGE